MKKIYLLLFFAGLSFMLCGQTATNFSVKDCAGLQYTLFDELNAGKVVVLTWTMPCGSCVLPLKTTYNVVQSYQSTHPGMVQMLIADDYANTSCASIDQWANSNGMPNTRRFSNSAINMMDYGSTGMPKAVVIGGPEKQVFYNANDAVDHVALQAAIQSAISVITSTPALAASNGLRLSYQAASRVISASGEFSENSQARLEVTTLTGQRIFSDEQDIARSSSVIHFALPMLPASAYIARLTSGNQHATLKFLVE
ncbi:MAG TPA: T9SS type A sorting domain-containing protein [Bacteroidales bacterium]|nr:T9SS type A sorting domain-containing protein [Bacteroidales bacterium]